MSRSYKKSPVISNGSDKKNEIRAHKQFRAKSKEKIKKVNYDDSGDLELIEILPEKLDEVSDVYDFKDKLWNSNATESVLRK